MDTSLNAKKFSLIRVPYASPDEIERSVDAVLAPILNRKTEMDFVLGSWRFAHVYREVIKPKYGIELIERANLGMLGKAKVFGAFDPVRNCAWIDQIASPESGHPRRTFVLWHEVIGHGVLQGDLLRAELHRCAEEAVLHDTTITLDDMTRERLEIQANMAAGAAAAPRRLVLGALIHRLESKRPIVFNGPNKYTIGRRIVEASSAWDLALAAASQIQCAFDGLSKHCLAIRIMNSRYFFDNTETGHSRMRLYRSA
ncbi:MAG: hypothetical protein KF691_14990 [Phycisphaeraceae bacterium]|nr:hypothetical protein [Phycisphaeraceae bacterium]